MSNFLKVLVLQNLLLPWRWNTSASWWWLFTLLNHQVNAINIFNEYIANVDMLTWCLVTLAKSYDFTNICRYSWSTNGNLRLHFRPVQQHIHENELSLNVHCPTFSWTVLEWYCIVFYGMVLYHFSFGTQMPILLMKLIHC